MTKIECPTCQGEGKIYERRTKEIVERSSGYWIVDGHGYADGPYDTVKEAQSIPEEKEEEVVNKGVGK